MSGQPPILVTRTVPPADFRLILAQVRRRFPNAELVLLLQENVVAALRDAGGAVRHYEVESGPLRFDALDERLIGALRREAPAVMVFPANNPAFAGYEEYYKLAQAIGVPQVLHLTRDLHEQAISRHNLGSARRRLVQWLKGLALAWLECVGALVLTVVMLGVGMLALPLLLLTWPLWWIAKVRDRQRRDA